MSNSKNTLDDVDLVRRILDGDEDAETAMIDKYSDGVWAILARWRVRGAVEAEDLFQDVWLTVLAKIRKGDLDSPAALRSFIATTARFVVNAAYRYESRRRHDEFDEGNLGNSQPPQWMIMDMRIRARLIKRYLDELAPTHREVLLLYFVSELPRKEICEILGINSQNLSRRLHAAKVALRKFIETRMPDLGWDNDQTRHF